MLDQPPSDDARLTDSAQGTARGSATQPSADASLAQAEQEPNAEHWIPRIVHQQFREQAEQEIATLKAEREREAQKRALVAGILDAKYLNPECCESGCQWLKAEQAQAALRALVEEWREEMHREQNPQRYTLLDRCVYQLDALLRSPVEERTRDEEQDDLARQSSASEAPDLGISAIPTETAPHIEAVNYARAYAVPLYRHGEEGTPYERGLIRQIAQHWLAGFFAAQSCAASESQGDGTTSPAVAPLPDAAPCPDCLWGLIASCERHAGVPPYFTDGKPG